MNLYEKPAVKKKPLTLTPLSFTTFEEQLCLQRGTDCNEKLFCKDLQYKMKSWGQQSFYFGQNMAGLHYLGKYIICSHLCAWSRPPPAITLFNANRTMLCNLHQKSKLIPHASGLWVSMCCHVQPFSNAVS